MPLLQNRRHEVFARVRANGARLDEAYEAAGYVPGRHHGSRLARMPAVAARIAEIREYSQAPDVAHPASVVSSLCLLAQANLALGAAGAKEARLAFMDAFRVRTQWKRERQEDFDLRRRVTTKTTPSLKKPFDIKVLYLDISRIRTSRPTKTSR